MRAAYLEWAMSALNDLGYSIIKSELVLDTAWSQVYRFQTQQGLVYLKKVPPALSLEAPVIELLAKQFKASVPNRTTEHLKLAKNQYRQLQEACFKPWLSIESSVHLFEIITIIKQC